MKQNSISIPAPASIPIFASDSAFDPVTHTVTRETLLSALNLMSKIGMGKGSINLLNMILIGNGAISGTNLNISIVSECSELTGKAFFVEYSKLKEFVKNTDKKTDISIKIEEKVEKQEIRGEEKDVTTYFALVNGTIGGQDVQIKIKADTEFNVGFPILPDYNSVMDSGVFFCLDESKKRDILSAFNFVSTDEDRFVLHHVFLDSRFERCCFWATDGRRLYMSKDYANEKDKSARIKMGKNKTYEIPSTLHSILESKELERDSNWVLSYTKPTPEQTKSKLTDTNYIPYTPYGILHSGFTRIYFKLSGNAAPDYNVVIPKEEYPYSLSLSAAQCQNIIKLIKSVYKKDKYEDSNNGKQMVVLDFLINDAGKGENKNNIRMKVALQTKDSLTELVVINKDIPEAPNNKAYKAGVGVSYLISVLENGVNSLSFCPVDITKEKHKHIKPEDAHEILDPLIFAGDNGEKILVMPRHT